MELAGTVPAHLLPDPLLFRCAELDRKDSLGLIFTPRIPLTWAWMCCTGAAKPLMPRHWIHTHPPHLTACLWHLFSKTFISIFSISNSFQLISWDSACSVGANDPHLTPALRLTSFPFQMLRLRPDNSSDLLRFQGKLEKSH